MKSYQVILLSALLFLALGSIKNTTDFWQRSLNAQAMHYQTFSGYQEIDWFYSKGTTGMFYNLFGAMGHDLKQTDSSIPLLIWLQGGPGASSQFGAFTEMGPIRIVNGTAKDFGQPWNILGHMLFIDNPLNVGFSWADSKYPLVSSARQAADHLLNFLYNFYKDWPQLQGCPLYITGQSFAGHYIPAFANRLLSNSSTFFRSIKFGGAAIGDGWTDPVNQINFYDSYLYSVGVVSNKFRDVCTWFQTNAIEQMYMGNYRNATPFFDFLTNNDSTSAAYWGGMSTYNFRHYGEGDMSFADFLQRNREEFGVGRNTPFVPGNDAIYDSFQQDVSRSYVGDVINVLKQARVLIYNGQDDFVVNTPGVLNYLNTLNWQGIPQWKRTRKQIWTLHGEVKGWAKVSGNLWFALVNHAGHMVPTDQPEAALNLLGHFIKDNLNWKE